MHIHSDKDSKVQVSGLSLDFSAIFDDPRNPARFPHFFRKAQVLYSSYIVFSGLVGIFQMDSPLFVAF